MNKMLDLLQRRAKVIAGAREIVTKATADGRALHPSEQQQLDTAIAEAEGINAQLHAEELGRAAGPSPRPEGLSGAALLDALETRIGPDLRRVGVDPPGSHRRTPSRAAEGIYRPDEPLASQVEGADADVDLGRLVKGKLTGNWKGAEAEREMLATLTRTSDTAGGYLTLPTILSSRVVDLARSAMVLTRAGAMTYNMDGPTVRFASVESDPTAVWHQENAEVTPSDPTFGSIELSAKTCAALVTLSLELVEDSPNAAGLISSLITKAIAQALDAKGLLGAGVLEPTGLLHWPGVTIATLGTGNGASPSYEDFGTVFTTLQTANAPEDGLAFIAHPRTFATLDALRTDEGGAGTGPFLAGPPSWSKFNPKLQTTALPLDQIEGASVDCSSAFCGNFAEMVIGIRSPLRLEVSRESATSTSSAFSRLQVSIRAYLRADVAVLRPKHFVVVSGIRP